MLNGKCHCGSVKFESKNEPITAVFCHCVTCRNINGSAFGSSAIILKDGFSKITGEEFIVGYESSPGKMRKFCSKCGTHVYATSSKKPENVILRIGCLESGHGVKPSKHIWVSQKESWYEITKNIPTHEEW